MGVFRVLGVVACDEDNVWADLFGFSNLGSGFDAKGLGLIAGSDAAGGVCHGRYYGEGPAPIFRVQLLFYRCEETVQVDMEEAEAVGM
jgi:hypothetical protein